MTRKILPILLLSLIAVKSNDALAVEPPFPNSTVVSDFGPRNYEGGFFHGGLDYSETAGTSIPAIESGTVVFVHGNDGDNGGWRMEIQGAVTGRAFLYMHMFDNTASSGTISGNFQLGKIDSTGKYFIKRVSDGVVFKAGASVAARDSIGPVGDSGSAAGHPHLHLQLGTNAENNLDNPFMYVDHDESGFVVTPVSPPYDGYVIRSTEIANYAFKFKINSLVGLDLDEVKVLLDGDPLVAPSDEIYPQRAFRYGGYEDQDPTNSAKTAAGETVALPAPLSGNATFRVNPISNGLDEFIIEHANLSNLSEGNHVLKIVPINVDWNESPVGGIEVDFIPFLAFSSVGHGFDHIFQSLVVKPVKFTNGTFTASHAQGEDYLLCASRRAGRSRSACAPRTARYTASYARGVALCPPLARLASAPLARSRTVEARPARGDGEKHLQCAVRQPARSRSAIAARTAWYGEAYPRDVAGARTRRPIGGAAPLALRLPQEARVAVGGRTSGGQLPRSPDADFFFFRPARKEFKIIAVLAANTANRIIHCDGETKNTGENYYG